MTRRVLAHYADMVRDFYFLGFIGGLVEGGAFFLQWVSFQQSKLAKLLMLTCLSHNALMKLDCLLKSECPFFLITNIFSRHFGHWLHAY